MTLRAHGVAVEATADERGVQLADLSERLAAVTDPGYSIPCSRTPHRRSSFASVRVVVTGDCE